MVYRAGPQRSSNLDTAASDFRLRGLRLDKPIQFEIARWEYQADFLAGEVNPPEVIKEELWVDEPGLSQGNKNELVPAEAAGSPVRELLKKLFSLIDVNQRGASFRSLRILRTCDPS